MSQQESENPEVTPLEPRTKSLITSGIFLVILVALAAILPVPYVILRPGPTFNALGNDAGKPVIQISGARSYPTTGGLNLTTVSESGGPFGKVSLAEAFFGWLSPSAAVLPERILYPQQAKKAEVESQNTSDLIDSQTQATAAALKYLNKPLVKAVLISAVSPSGASAGKLQPGDVVGAIDGVKPANASQAARAVTSKPVGAVVKFTLTRDGKVINEQVTTRASTSKSKTSVVGIVVANGFISTEISVRYGLENVGGPSAGLMFSLGVIDKLTLSSLTGGKIIAGTGTINSSGSVGPIGGVQQKVVAAKRDGASYFLTPVKNCYDASQAAPKGLTLVRVDSLTDAVAQLDNIVKGRPTQPC